MRRSIPLLAFIAACSSDAPGAPKPVVQLVSITAAVTTVQCGVIPDPDTVYINVHMVSTMTTDVPITSVGTWGLVIRATPDSVRNSIAMDLTNLPLVPLNPVLAARVGDITFRVSMPTKPICNNNPLRASSRDIQTQVRVTTPVGQYVSFPFTFNMQ